ncbi:hypothetical protein GW17_00062485 [Ensete ventricosum]|nr:hypothetical protein GW17_00062485 [Ensete ventricosum]
MRPYTDGLIARGAAALDQGPHRSDRLREGCLQGRSHATRGDGRSRSATPAHGDSYPWAEATDNDAQRCRLRRGDGDDHL